MSLLALAETFAIYACLAFIASALILAVVINWSGKLPPLLDGTPVGSALDDHDRRHMVDRCVAAEDREVRAVDELAVQLEEIRLLPTVEPWRRWIA